MITTEMKTTPKKMLTVSIWRGADEGEFVEYQVPLRANQTVLDIVTEVQRNQEPDLAYRFACRVGVCGSCAMTVNGRPRWTCRSHVNDVIDGDRLVLEPLRSHPRIRDLVVDLVPFFETWKDAGAVFKPTATRHDKPVKISANDPAREKADAGIECINCAVCYSACDVVSWDENYLGPAALNRAWTLVNDAKHGARKETLSKALGDGGCGSCHSMGNCTRNCPVGLSPSAGIAGLKKFALRGLPSLDKPGLDKPGIDKPGIDKL